MPTISLSALRTRGTKTPFISGFRRVTNNGQNICPMRPCVPADVITSTCKRTHCGRYQYAQSPWPRIPGTWNGKIPLYIREWFSQCHKERSKHPSDVSTCTKARRHINLRAVTSWRPSVRLLGPHVWHSTCLARSHGVSIFLVTLRKPAPIYKGIFRFHASGARHVAPQGQGRRPCRRGCACPVVIGPSSLS